MPYNQNLLQKLYNGTLTPSEKILVIHNIQKMIDNNKRIIKLLEKKKQKIKN